MYTIINQLYTDIVTVALHIYGFPGKPSRRDAPRRDRAVNVSVSHGAPVDMSTVLVSRQLMKTV